MEQQQCSAQEAEAAVHKLCEFNTHYLETHTCASRRTEEVRQLMEDTLKRLEELQDAIPKPQYWYLRGKSLNVLPDHSPEAEQCLSRAIKHDPSVVDAWNCLGESYWKAGNVQQAHDCFTGALVHAKNKESLRNLSMVLRQMGKDPSEREANVRDSVQKAREAVAMDVKDGLSWTILGNAYLSLFFMSGQDPKVLKQCTSAYSQAEKDPVTANNPDLHFNKATLCHYEEQYGDALMELSTASRLDPTWSIAQEKMDKIRTFLKTMMLTIGSKGKLKQKRLTSITASITASCDKYAGVYAGSGTVVGISQLRDDQSPDALVFLGGIVATITTKEHIPYGCVLVDGNGECVGLTVYNLAQTTHFSVGDIITIPSPLIRQTHIQIEEIQFWSIRVTNPSLLLVNGHKLSPQKLASSVVSITAFS